MTVEQGQHLIDAMNAVRNLVVLQAVVLGVLALVLVWLNREPPGEDEALKAEVLRLCRYLRSEPEAWHVVLGQPTEPHGPYTTVGDVVDRIERGLIGPARIDT